MIEICYCGLSGDFHIVRDGKACELCNAEERVEFTPENVENAFKEYQRRLTEKEKQ